MLLRIRINLELLRCSLCVYSLECIRREQEAASCPVFIRLPPTTTTATPNLLARENAGQQKEPKQQRQWPRYTELFGTMDNIDVMKL